MTEKMLIIHDVQYFNYATVHFTDDHPTDDLENYFDWELEPAPPKDWQERLHKVAELTQYISETGDGTEAGFNSIDVAISRLKDVATLKLQIIELVDANSHLAKVNDKLMAEKKKNIAWLDQALNEGDGVYRP
jgi:hypothetical protein